MESLADALPPEIASQIHPDWRKNEADYWTVRDALLQQYRDQWVAFADGTVIAFGRNPTNVFHDGVATGRHPYFTRVGHENEPERVRRTTYAYDTSYPGEAMPYVSVEFRTDPLRSGAIVARVIPDIGADVTILPWSDCQQLHLVASDGIPTMLGGVGQLSTATVAFAAWACIENTAHPCRIHGEVGGRERILGRDVLNRIDVLFRATTGEVILNP